MVKTTVNVDGMMCAHCEAHMNEAIKNNFDVKEVASDHEKKETVIISKEALDEDKVKGIVEETGYTFLGMNSEEYKKKGLFGFLKK